MSHTPRSRFILLVTLSYAVLALAWIFLSDKLLAVFTDIDSIVWLSTAKGMFFVVATAALLFIALRTVPPASSDGQETLLGSMSSAAQEHRPGWLIYLFAALLPLTLLVARQGMGGGNQPMLILLMLPIILSALLGGLGPGLLSTVVAALGVDYLALQPLHSLHIAASEDLLQWAFLIANGVAVSLLSELLRRSQTKTEAHRRLLDAVVSGTSDAVFVKDLQGRYLLANAATAAFVKQPITSILGHDDHALFPSMTAHEVMAHDRAILAAGKTQTNEERVTTTDGQALVFLATKGPIFDETGRVCGLFGVSRDISHIKMHQAELDRIAHYDPLTGSPNRCLLADRLAQAILQATRSAQSLAVCFLDLDGFKAVNDQYGHTMGDQLLIGVTENLKHVLRANDTLARIGGDEFVLLFSGISSPEECAQILDRVLQVVSTPVQIGDLPISISASIGVSLYPQDKGDADTLLRHADQAMYLAKEAGKNRYHLFDPENDRKAQLHRKQLEDLRKALAGDEFVLHYQPKVDLVSGEVFGAEALIRWQHPERGLLPPAQFLPQINGSDLEKPLGEWVINTALAQAASWHRLGLKVCVSANVSASHLLQPDFDGYLKAALARHTDVPADHFELEVLETAAIADMAQAVDVLQRCRALGVHFALDDFGTGYSSLTYLRKLPVDMLKIDQSFVRDMLTDADDMGIVESVIGLAKAFNRQVIAEGVETLAHGAALLRLGCPLAQGYGIARPMPAEQLAAWTTRWQSQAVWRTLT